MPDNARRISLVLLAIWWAFALWLALEFALALGLVWASTSVSALVWALASAVWLASLLAFALMMAVAFARYLTIGDALLSRTMPNARAVGDLLEERGIRAQTSPTRARIWFVWQVAGSAFVLSLQSIVRIAACRGA